MSASASTKTNKAVLRQFIADSKFYVKEKVKELHRVFNGIGRLESKLAKGAVKLQDGTDLTRTTIKQLRSQFTKYLDTLVEDHRDTLAIVQRSSTRAGVGRAFYEVKTVSGDFVDFVKSIKNVIGRVDPTQRENATIRIAYKTFDKDAEGKDVAVEGSFDTKNGYVTDLMTTLMGSTPVASQVMVNKIIQFYVSKVHARLPTKGNLIAVAPDVAGADGFADFGRIALRSGDFGTSKKRDENEALLRDGLINHTSLMTIGARSFTGKADVSAETAEQVRRQEGILGYAQKQFVDSDAERKYRADVEAMRNDIRKQEARDKKAKASPAASRRAAIPAVASPVRGRSPSRSRSASPASRSASRTPSPAASRTPSPAARPARRGFVPRASASRV